MSAALFPRDPHHTHVHAPLATHTCWAGAATGPGAWPAWSSLGSLGPARRLPRWLTLPPRVGGHVQLWQLVPCDIPTWSTQAQGRASGVLTAHQACSLPPAQSVPVSTQPHWHGAPAGAGSTGQHCPGRDLGLSPPCTQGSQRCEGQWARAPSSWPHPRSPTSCPGHKVCPTPGSVRGKLEPPGPADHCQSPDRWPCLGAALVPAAVARAWWGSLAC